MIADDTEAPVTSLSLSVLFNKRENCKDNKQRSNNKNINDSNIPSESDGDRNSMWLWHDDADATPMQNYCSIRKS